MPICRHCKSELTDSNWYPSNQRNNNKLCNRCHVVRGNAYNKKLRIKHGRTPITALTRKLKLSLEDVQEKERRQLGRCAICGTDRPAGKSGKLHIDHDHNTNAVRDLLCLKCNQGLGLFMDNPDLLEAAAAYIRWHKRLGKRAA